MSSSHQYSAVRPLQFYEGKDGRSHFRERQQVVTRLGYKIPGRSLRSICREVASPAVRRTELIIYLFFVVLAIGAVGFCFSGLFELLNGGALEQTVFALLTR